MKIKNAIIDSSNPATSYKGSYHTVLNKFINIERLIHSIKTVIACLLGFLVTKLFDFPTDQWIVITILVVMCAQIYVGSVFQKAYFRFLGTLVGCCFATIALIFAGNTNLIIAATLGLSSFIFSYLATSREDLTYAGTLGAVTTAIIMLGDPPTILLALERFLEISAGIVIAALVSQFVLPIHARTHLRRAQTTTLEQLHDYYAAAIASPDPSKKETDFQDQDAAIANTLLKQRQLAKESKREPLGLAFNPQHFTQTLYSEREILRSITFMHNALTHIKSAHLLFIESPLGIDFNRSVLEALSILTNVIDTNDTPKEAIRLQSIAALKEELQTNIKASSPEELLYIDGFLFSMEILVNHIEKLAKLYHVPCHLS